MSLPANKNHVEYFALCGIGSAKKNGVKRARARESSVLAGSLMPRKSSNRFPCPYSVTALPICRSNAAQPATVVGVIAAMSASAALLLSPSIGSRPRLVLSLLLYTGQRRSDVVRMGKQHVRNGLIAVRQIKTGVALQIPIHATLAAVIAATPSEHLTYLTTQFGTPFTAADFGNWFPDQCNLAGLSHCSAHGLRKAAARRLAEAACTAHEIAAITGHASLREVQCHTKAADQVRLAVSAMDRLCCKSIFMTRTSNIDSRMHTCAQH